MVTKTDSGKMYVLHKQAYKNNSLIVTLLSEEAELRRGIYFGGQKKGLSLFTPYWVVLTPRDNLSLFHDFDALSTPPQLKGKRLFCSLYLNELLYKLLREYTASHLLLALYENALVDLEGNCSIEPLLRQFERKLISFLGYELSFNIEAKTQKPIQSRCYYSFEPHSGFILLETVDNLRHHKAFLGSHLLSIEKDEYHDACVAQVAKRVMRDMFHFLLQGKPLISRELFVSKVKEKS
jgi:DNA repair protein RecO (recombination protein O)